MDNEWTENGQNGRGLKEKNSFIFFLRASILRPLIVHPRLFFYALFVAIFLSYGWAVWTSLSIPLPSKKKPILFYSNQCRCDLKLLFCKALKEAKQSIHFSMYALTDEDILNIIKQKAKEGVSVHILYDPSASSTELEKSGLSLKPKECKGLMHRKILVVDDSKVFLGSANMTLQSLTMHDNFVMGLFHPELAQFIAHPSSSCLPFTIGDQSGEFWLLPDKKKEALTALITKIKEAKKNIHIALFTFTHPLLTNALIEAAARGVKVAAAIDFYTGEGASLKTVDLLKSAHIPIYLSRGRQLLHHKWAFIDNEVFITGSANWTQAAFSKNEDYFVVLNRLTKDQKKFIKTMWQILNLESQ